MTRWVSILLTAVLLLQMFPTMTVTVGAYETVGDYRYTNYNNMDLKITKYSGTETDVVIPSELNGHPVVEIVKGAFNDADTVETIHIPASVRTIDPEAFSYAPNIHTFTVSEDNPHFSAVDGVIFSKDQTVLWRCPTARDTAYNVPETVVTIEEASFSYCEVLPSVVIPDSVTTINKEAFRCCFDLSSVSLSDNLNRMTASVFESCSSLTEVTIPEGVSRIDAQAFFWCNDLQTITLPSTLQSVGQSAFTSDFPLEVYYPLSEADWYDVSIEKYNAELALATMHYGLESDPLPVTSDPSNYTYTASDDGTAVIKTFHGVGPYVSIPSEIDGYQIVGIDKQAFYSCERVKTIVVPEGVVSIGSSAFNGCALLEDITLPSTLETIGESAFNSCVSLKQMTIPAGVTSIGKWALLYCNVTAYEVDENNAVFSDIDGVLCNKDQTVLLRYPDGRQDTAYTVPDGIKEIADYAFLCNQVLTTVSVPKSVKVLRYMAFSRMAQLMTVHLSEGLEILEQDTFYESRKLANVSLPSTVHTLGRRVFGNTAITEMTIPYGITEIPSALFWATDTLTVTIPDTVTSVGDEVFSYADVTIYSVAGTAIEDYVENGLQVFCTLTFIPLIKLTDDATGVAVTESVDGAVSDTAALTVSVQANRYQLEMNEELNGTVRVTVPVRSDCRVAEVYREEADGTLTKMKATVVCGVITFETDELGTFVIASAGNGDIDADGVTDTTDARSIMQHIVGISMLQDDLLLAADYDGNGVVNTSDVRALLLDVVNTVS